MAKAANAKKKPLTKNEILASLAESTELSKKDVDKVLNALTDLIHKSIKKTDEVFTLPGLLKIRNVRKNATKPRQGINPKTQQPIEIAGKPAHNAVKVTALKQLKGMVSG